MGFLKNIEKNKIIQINFGIDKIKNLYKYNKNNYKIIFIGNIKYTPNRQACLNFIKQIFPKLKSKFSNIEFHVFGEIRDIDKNFFMRTEGVKFYGKIKNLEPYLSKVICGLANLNISTGIQTKLLTYMSYGIPSISSKQVIENFDKISSNKKNVNIYKIDIKYILKKIQPILNQYTNLRIYYFISPKILLTKNNTSKRMEYKNFFIDTPNKILSLIPKNFNIEFFYPSTVFIDDKRNDDYTQSKIIDEKTLKKLNRKNIKINILRIDKINTKQNLDLLNTKKPSFLEKLNINKRYQKKIFFLKK